MAVTALEAANDVLNRAEQLLILDCGRGDAPLIDYDIRRLSLAMGVAGLDTYFHWAIRGANLNTLSALSPEMAKLEVPFAEVVRISEGSLSARRRGVNDRPQTRARSTLNQRLLTMTFQNARSVERGLSLIGIRSGLSAVAAAMAGAETRNSIKDRLNRLSYRRNMIVHEGDLRRLVRPQQVTRNVLRRADVEDDIRWLRSFIGALDAVR